MRTRIKLLFSSAAILFAGALSPEGTLRTVAADGEVDVSVFYGPLAAHGEWIQVQPYGWAWAPENVDYGWRPYTVGQWAWVDAYGWTWVSEEPWGWATYHYGRWAYVDDYGWVWVPGTAWAPAWVVFRYGDPWVGWAPLPPTSGWRFDAGFDVAGLNANVDVGTYAWSFVQLRFFAEAGLQSRVAVNAYNPYLVQRTQWSTRYAAVDGGIANRSIDLALVDKARGKPVPRRRLQDAKAPERDVASRIHGDDVTLYRPRIAPKAPAQAPAPRVRGERKAPTRAETESWAAQRQAAIKAHLEAQKKALEEQDDPSREAPGRPNPGMSPGKPPDDEAAKRREAGLKAVEDERKRLEALLERQRKRREMEEQPPAPQPKPPPPAMDDNGGMGMDDNPGMGDDGHGMR